MPIVTLAISITAIWILMRGTGDPSDFFSGIIIAILIIRFLWKSYEHKKKLIRRNQKKEKNFLRLMFTLQFLLSFIWELIVANFQVMLIVIKPKLSIQPGILAYKTRCKSPLAITSLANSITLTPGTLSIDVSDDSETIYVHTLDIQDSKEVKNRIQKRLENPIMGAFE
ncbi:MAG: Na+/H+ antiporter subunit E [Nitrospinota bacterium]|nr:Na+/H+ antiporter subunit E [Nitrospinota bacterium]